MKAGKEGARLPLRSGGAAVGDKALATLVHGLGRREGHCGDAASPTSTISC